MNLIVFDWSTHFITFQTGSRVSGQDPKRFALAPLALGLSRAMPSAGNIDQITYTLEGAPVRRVAGACPREGRDFRQLAPNKIMAIFVATLGITLAATVPGALGSGGLEPESDGTCIGCLGNGNVWRWSWTADSVYGQCEIPKLPMICGAFETEWVKPATENTTGEGVVREACVWWPAALHWWLPDEESTYVKKCAENGPQKCCALEGSATCTTPLNSSSPLPGSDGGDIGDSGCHESQAACQECTENKGSLAYAIQPDRSAVVPDIRPQATGPAPPNLTTSTRDTACEG